MGEDAIGPSHGNASGRPSLEGVLLVDTYDLIAPYYDLKDELAFEELTEYLIFLCCVHQEDKDTAHAHGPLH